MPHVLAWPGLPEGGFSARSGSSPPRSPYPWHPVPAATCSWAFLHPPPLRVFRAAQSMPWHFSASFFLAANTPLLPQFFFFLLQHIPLCFQSQPALCLLTLSTCSDLQEPFLFLYCNKSITQRHDERGAQVRSHFDQKEKKKKALA